MHHIFMLDTKKMITDMNLEVTLKINYEVLIIHQLKDSYYLTEGYVILHPCLLMLCLVHAI